MNNLKAASWMAVMDTTNLTSVTDNKIAACLVYKAIYEKTMTYNEELSTSLTTAKKLAKTAIDNLVAYKAQYASYHDVKKLIESQNDVSFVNYSDSFIESVCTAYFKMVKMVPFSVSMFSDRMYLLDAKDAGKLEYLKHVHYDIICPIFSYYAKRKGIAPSQMHIYSANSVLSNPGKEVMFYIDTIASITIKNDVETGRIPIEGSYYDWIMINDGKVDIQTE